MDVQGILAEPPIFNDFAATKAYSQTIFFGTPPTVPLTVGPDQPFFLISDEGPDDLLTAFRSVRTRDAAVLRVNPRSRAGGTFRLTSDVPAKTIDPSAAR